MFRKVGFACCLVVGLLGAVARAQERPRGMPKEDVIDIPAVGEGLCLHNLFQTNMVLQRDKPIHIWGWAAAGEKVTVSFAGQTKTATADDHRAWKVALSALSASAEPRKLTVQGEQEKLVLENVLVGDVWLLGGQSNMEFPISRVENGALEIASAHFPQIRILTVPTAEGPEPAAGFPRLYEWSGWFGRHFRKGDWQVCSPETVPELSAIGYVFARRIQMATQIPIGVIDASRGGTTVETWTPASVLANLDVPEVRDLLADWQQRIDQWDAEADLQNRIRRHHDWVKSMQAQGKPIPKDRTEPNDLRPGPAKDHNRPGNCYAGMIAPIAGLSIKGAIFHQGYNNCFNGTPGAIMYRHVFPEMITVWRAAFGDPALPFGILSLCTEGKSQTREDFTAMMFNVGPYIREAQYQTFLQFLQAGDEHIGFVSTYDLRRRWYHPQLKVPAGERIARWALATEYGMERTLAWQPPMLQEMAVEESRIVLKFDRPVAAVDNGLPIEGFAIAGSDRKFHPADASYVVVGKDDRGRSKTDARALVLTSPMVAGPVHFRYAWARSPLGNLQAQGHSDIPFATQRSDTWPLENVPLNVLGEDPPAKLDRGQRRKVQEALQQEDLRRRMIEAKALLQEQQ